MLQKELLHAFREKFKETKKDLSFKSTLKEIDDIFFIEDFIIHERFISTYFNRQILRRIVDTYNSWVNYLHGLLIPNPANFLIVMESRMLNQDDKKKISSLIKGISSLSSSYSLLLFTKDKKMKANLLMMQLFSGKKEAEN